MTKNQIEYWNLRETQRSNRAREQETRRANLAQERISGTANDIRYSLGLQQNTETHRSNVAKETETSRNNRVNNALEYWKQQIAESQLGVNKYNAETTRSLGFANLAETQRANLVREAQQMETIQIQDRTQQEQARHNIQQENATRLQNATSHSDQYGRNVANIQNANTRTQELAETTRSHKAQERITRENNLYNIELRSLELQNRITQDTASNQSKFLNAFGTNLANVMKGGSSYAK